MAIPTSSFHISSTELLRPNSHVLGYPSKSSCSYRSRRFFITITNSKLKSVGAAANDEKREFLEKYGLNPDDYLPKSSPKKKSRKEPKNSRMRGSLPVVVEEEPKPARETHKLLQVLGGTARRKKLLSPKGLDVRPMMEVVKGAAFSILQAAGGSPQSLKPGRWLDLYSGTGSVGIEAISRGCSEVHFVEMDPWVVSSVLTPNLEATNFLNVSTIHTIRVETFLENAERFLGKDGVFDYISVTPPYMLVDYDVLMYQISNSPFLGENTFMVVEYPLGTKLSDSCGPLIKITDRRFGRTHLAIYGPKWADKKSKLIMN